jgi:transposase
LTDEQWALVGPLLPAPRTGGRPEKHPRRSIVDGILYVVRTGCAWRYLPADFPPWQTVYWYFKQWEQAKVTEVMLAALREQARVQQGRNPQPSAGIIDPQSVKGADIVGRDSRGLRRRQEDQRQEAVHRHRHLGPAHRGRRARRERAGP